VVSDVGEVKDQLHLLIESESQSYHCLSNDIPKDFIFRRCRFWARLISVFPFSLSIFTSFSGSDLGGSFEVERADKGVEASGKVTQASRGSLGRQSCQGRRRLRTTKK
jgi:hypothetical protein